MPKDGGAAGKQKDGPRGAKADARAKADEDTIRGFVKDAVASILLPSSWLDQNFALLLRKPDTDGYRRGSGCHP